MLKRVIQKVLKILLKMHMIDIQEILDACIAADQAKRLSNLNEEG